MWSRTVSESGQELRAMLRMAVFLGFLPRAAQDIVLSERRRCRGEVRVTSEAGLGLSGQQDVGDGAGAEGHRQGPPSKCPRLSLGRGQHVVLQQRLLGPFLEAVPKPAPQQWREVQRQTKQGWMAEGLRLTSKRAAPTFSQASASCAAERAIEHRSFARARPSPWTRRSPICFSGGVRGDWHLVGDRRNGRRACGLQHCGGSGGHP